MCERCRQIDAGRSYCSSACRLREFRKRLVAQTATIMARAVPRPLAIAAIGTALALLVLAVGSLAGQLLENSGFGSELPVIRPTPLPQLMGRLFRDNERWQVDVYGPANIAVLVAAEGDPLQVVVLDDSGYGTAALKLLSDKPKLELIPLGTQVITLAPATATPTVTATATASATATKVRTRARPTATARRRRPTSPPHPSFMLGAAKTTTPTVSPSPTPAPLVPSPTRSVSPSPTPARLVRGPTRPPRSSSVQQPPILHLVTDGGSRLAITFDGGSSSAGTAELLDLLSELDLDVTLFVTGQFIEREPRLVRRALLDGHEIGNHTFSHPHLTTYASNKRHELLPDLSREWFEQQLLRTEAAFFKVTGRHLAPLWRAPFGEENRQLRGWALQLGYLHVRWSALHGASLDSRDWVHDEHSSLYQSSSRMMERLLSFPSLSGGIVLMHLASERATPPWQMLPEFFSKLQQRGIVVVKVTTLLEASPTWRKWLNQARQRQAEQNQSHGM